MKDMVREDILNLGSINDIVRLFQTRGFSENRIGSGEATVRISQDKEFLKIVQIDSLSDIQKHHTGFKYLGVEYLLLVTKNFENFVFMKKGFSNLGTEKFQTFKFNKSNITNTTLKKLNDLVFGTTDAFDRLFAVKEVVRQFFDQFQKQHEKFSESIAEIPEKEKRDWYASIIINRLMFIYFLQKKK